MMINDGINHVTVFRIDIDGLGYPARDGCRRRTCVPPDEGAAHLVTFDDDAFTLKVFRGAGWMIIPQSPSEAQMARGQARFLTLRP